MVFDLKREAMLNGKAQIKIGSTIITLERGQVQGAAIWILILSAPARRVNDELWRQELDIPLDAPPRFNDKGPFKNTVISWPEDTRQLPLI